MRRLAALALLALAAGCGPAPSAGPDRRPGLALSPAPSAGPDRRPGPAPSPAPSSAAALAWSSCGQGFECATLTVPLDLGATTGLAVTRRRATGVRTGSLVVNPGGPGASAVDYLQAAWSGLPAPLRERFDLVAFDPRGVGRSSAVRCADTPGLDAWVALDPDPDDPAELAELERGTATLVQGCAARSGALLPYVSTAAAAQDLERLRAALGDERLTFLGYSYGTALGAAYLDAFPGRVRAMVLDGALDPALTWDELIAGQARGFDAALVAFLDDCERVRCAFRRAVDGPLPAAYDALAARVDDDPLPVGDRALGPGELSYAVGAGLYDSGAGWDALATALADAQRGDGRALLGLSDAYLQRTASGYAPVAEGNLAVSCIDRPWPRDTAAYVALAERLRDQAPRFGPAIVLAGLACAQWPVPAVSSPRPVRGQGAPPVVVVGTTGDPVTPYAWSVALAAQLAAGVLVTYVGDGHTIYRAGGPACLVAPLTDYLVEAVAPGPLTC